jgi:hypothetical protein
MLRRWVLVLAFVLALLPLRGLVAALHVSAPSEYGERASSTPEYAAIASHLRGRFDGYGPGQVLIPQFGIVALSHMASGMMSVYVAEPEKRDEAHAYVLEIRRRALSARISPWRTATDGATRLDDNNLFWSHLALILGIERYMRCEGRVCPTDGDEDRLHERVVRHLRARTMQTGFFAAPSYPGSPMWPADQTVTLLSLRLFDVTRGTSLLAEPLSGFLATLRPLRDGETGLFPSSLSPQVAHYRIPRGCATSWSISYLAQLDVAAAREQYDAARTAFAESILGVGGFREWPRGREPRGREGAGDLDSGPIILGVGVAATGLGLGASRLFGDESTYTTIRRSALVFGLPAWWPWNGYWAAPLLGEAILFDGRSARPWFEPIAPVEQRPVSAPIAPVLLAAMDIAILAFLGRALVRLKAWRLR